MTTLSLGPTDGSLLLLTKASGRAKNLAHDLTIRMTNWSVKVHLDGVEPTLGELDVDMSAFDIDSASGGVTPLTPVDRAGIRRNLMNTLNVKRHGTVTFSARTIEHHRDGYNLTGPLRIAGVHRDIQLVAHRQDQGNQSSLSVNYEVKQSDFEVKPYSAMFGALRVADEVEVRWTVHIPKIAG